MTAFAVIPGTELEIEVYDGVSAYIAVGGVTELTLGDGQTAFSETSDFSTTGNKTYVAGLRSLGNGSFNFNYYQSDAGQSELKEMWENKETRAMRVTFSSGDIANFDAIVSTWSLNAAGSQDNKVTGTFSLIHDGDITWT
jgi:predicted secreted protein